MIHICSCVHHLILTILRPNTEVVSYDKEMKANIEQVISITTVFPY